MVEISEIDDRESLEAWLLEQGDPKAASAIIAHRAAMRVLPIAWAWFADPARKSDLTAIPVLRSLLTSGMVCFAGIPEVRLAYAAASAAYAAATAAADAANAAAYAAAYAAANAAADAANAAAYAAANAARAADAAATAASAAANAARAADAWDDLRNDCADWQNGVPLLGEKLLTTPSPLWETLKSDLRARSTGSEATARGEPDLDWSFWIDWYERALAGTETRWEMLEEIALLEDEVWTGDPSALMDQINAIWGKYSAASLRNGETLSVNPETGRYRAEAASADSDELYAEARGKLAAVLNLPAFQEPLENQYSALREELEMLRDANTAHVDAPRMLHSTCIRTRARLIVKFKQEVCPKPEEDANCLDLLGSVDEVISDLVSYNVPVKEAVIAKAKVSFELDQDRSDVIAEADDRLAEISEGVLAEQMPELAEVIRDPKASDDEKAEALYVSAARLLRVGVIEGYKGSKSVASEVEWWSERGVKLTTNAGKILGVTAAVSTPLWLQQAIAAILGML